MLRAEHDRLLQRGDDALGDLVGNVGVVEILDEHGKLVASEARRGIALSQTRRESFADDAQQVVAREVAEAVVDGLEVVEVDEQHRELAALAFQPRRRVVDPVAEERLVGQSGQRIVERLVRELVLEPAVLGDVAEAPHPPDDFAVDALRERIAFEDAPVLELEQVVTLRFGVRVELLHLGDERSGVAELIEHERERVVVVARLEGLRREAPHLDEAAVETGDVADLIDDEDAVGRRLERRREDRVGRAEVALRDHAIGDVMPGRDQSFDRRVIEQVGDGDRERDRISGRVAEAEINGHRRRSCVARRLHIAERVVEHGVITLVDDVEEWPAFEPLLIVAEDASQATRRRGDDAGARQQDRDRCRVLHERAKPCDLVAGDLPAPALGQVAHAEQELVAEGRADHLDQPPSLPAAHAQLEQRTDLLRLHARDREHRELEIVGVDEVEAVGADGFRDRDAEHPFRRPIRPPHPSLCIDHQHRVGQGVRDGSEHDVVGHAHLIDTPTWKIDPFGAIPGRSSCIRRPPRSAPG